MLHQLTIQSADEGFDYVGRRRKLSRLQKLTQAPMGVQAMYSDIRILAATIQGRLVASVIFDIVAHRPEIFIMDVFVRKSVRKQGICRKLLARLAVRFPKRKFNGTFVNPIIFKEALKLNSRKS